jgi:E3 ubiquitin-protein ligase MUL1
VKKLESRNTVLKLAICAVVSVGAFVAARRVKAWWSRRQLLQMRDVILRERSNVDIEGLNEFQICSVCLHNPREVILLNCGHVCCCYDCCLHLKGKCPVCRSTIVSTHPAYIS